MQTTYSKQQARDNLRFALSQIVLAVKTVQFYTRVLWRAVRDLYNWQITDGQFIDTQIRLIEEQLTRAWNAGARDVGVDPDEMTPDDLALLRSIQDNEYKFVLKLAQDIVNARAFKQPVDPFRARVDLWVNRYNETENRARVYFGGKQKLEWVIGQTEQSCNSCQGLDGIVAWASEWEEVGVYPQRPPNGALACHGWNCGCSLRPTDKRRTPRALSRIADAAVSTNV